jgi:hypothetical protein
MLACFLLFLFLCRVLRIRQETIPCYLRLAGSGGRAAITSHTYHPRVSVRYGFDALFRLILQPRPSKYGCNAPLRSVSTDLAEQLDLVQKFPNGRHCKGFDGRSVCSVWVVYQRTHHPACCCSFRRDFPKQPVPATIQSHFSRKARLKWPR